MQAVALIRLAGECIRDESALEASTQIVPLFTAGADLLAASEKAESVQNTRRALRRLVREWYPGSADSSLAAALDSCRATYPQQPLVYELAAEFHVLNGDLEQAAGAYREQLSLRPRNTEGLLGLAQALERLGRVDEALAVHMKAVEVNLAEEQPYGPAIRLASRAGTLDALASRWELLLRANRDEEALRRNLVYVWNKLGRNDKVVALVDQVQAAHRRGRPREPQSDGQEHGTSMP